MDSINTRRWPRNQVHLPVFIVGHLWRVAPSWSRDTFPPQLAPDPLK